MFQMNEIARKREGKRRRVSSYDCSGGNDDRRYIRPGETFTMAAFLEEGKDILEAMKLSTVVSGLQVQRHGAIPSMPYRNEVEAAASLL